MAEKKIDPTNLEIIYQDAKIKVNLFKKVPYELMMKNFKWQSYIPAPLVRAICAGLKIYPTDIDINTEFASQWAVISVELYIDNICWAAQDYYWAKKVATTMFPWTARVVSLAIKSALKFKYPFFEWEFYEEWEDEESVGDIAMTKEEVKEMAVTQQSATSTVDAVAKYTQSIEEATDTAKLKPIWLLIANDKSLDENQKETLKNVYVAKTKSFKS